MSINQLLRSPDHVEDEIRQDVIEVRRLLPELGYQEVAVFKEGRRGLLYCAVWKRAEETNERAYGIGYGRVSTVLQSGNHSLVTQIHQMLQVAQERGQTIRFIYIDAGYTGRDDRRPAFSRMIRHSVRGHKGWNNERDENIALVCVYDLYRFYRNLNGLTSHFALLQENKIDLVSAADKNTDYGSRDGKLLLYLKGIMGELYLDDLSRTTSDNKYSRARDGLSNASQPPFGYCQGNCLDCTDNNGKDYCPRFGGPDLWRELSNDPGVFVPHPIESIAFQRAAEQYATGQYSDLDIAEMLNRSSHRVDEQTTVRFRPKGRPGRAKSSRTFRKDSVRDMLQNPYYAGFVLYRPMRKEKGVRNQAGKRTNPLGHSDKSTLSDAIWFPGKHIPLISQELSRRCLEVRGTRGHTPHSTSRSTVRVYPLSGIPHCVHCAEPFRGTAARGNVRYYEDVGRAQRRTKCPVRSVRAEELEEPVFSWVRQNLSVPQDRCPGILTFLRDDERWTEVRRQRRSLESQRRAIQAEFRMGMITEGEYEQAARRVEREITHLSGQDQEMEEGFAAFLDDFPRLWDAATPLERKTLLHCIFRDIHVLDGVITRYVPRDAFKPFFPRALLSETPSSPGA